jgi:hypothetical protein
MSTKTKTEKKDEAQKELNKLPIPKINPKQVEQAGQALEKVAEKDKDVSADLTGMVDTLADKTIITAQDMKDLPKPWVVLDNVQIQPIATGLVARDGKLTDPAEEKKGPITSKDRHRFIGDYDNSARIYVDYYGADVDDLVFSRFRITINSIEVDLILDSRSSVNIHQLYAQHYINREDSSRDAMGRPVVILINSSCEHDAFNGRCTLVDVDSKRSDYSGTRINGKSTTASGDLFPRPWMSKKLNDSGRMPVESSCFVDSFIEDATIPSGRYVRTQIRNSTIRGEGQNRFIDTNVSNSTVKATNICLKRCNLNTVSFVAKGLMYIVNARLENLRNESDELYMPNKFCSLIIDLPHGEMSIWRTGVNKMSMGLDTYSAVDLELTEDLNVIEAKVKELLEIFGKGSYRAPGIDAKGTDVLSRNLLFYVVQTIRSRLRVIKLLDTATDMARVVTGENGQDDLFNNRHPF